MLKRVTTLGPIGDTVMPGTWASLITAMVIFCITRLIIVPLVVQILTAFLLALGAFWIL